MSTSRAHSTSADLGGLIGCALAYAQTDTIDYVAFNGLPRHERTPRSIPASVSPIQDNDREVELFLRKADVPVVDETRDLFVWKGRDYRVDRILQEDEGSWRLLCNA